MNKKKSTLGHIISALGILTLIAVIAYSIYYFFFAEDEEALEGDFFDEAEETEAAADAAQIHEETPEEHAGQVEFATP